MQLQTRHRHFAHIRHPRSPSRLRCSVSLLNVQCQAHHHCFRTCVRGTAAGGSSFYCVSPP
eukprot:1679696-Rhodomonas_salina.1